MLTTEIKDLNTLFRYIYPGIVLTLYLYFRWFNVTLNPNFIFIATVLVLISGIVIYPVYRFVWYDHVIRYIEYRLKRYPQYSFHCRIIDNMSIDLEKSFSKKEVKEIEQKMKKRGTASAFLANQLTKSGNENFRAETTRFNSTVHVLFITGFLAILILLIETIIPICAKFKIYLLTTLIDKSIIGDFSVLWLIISILSLILMTLIGIVADNQADQRELIFLVNEKENYKKAILDYILSEFKL